MKLFLSIALFQAKGQAEYFGVNLIFEVVPEKFGIEKKFSYFGQSCVKASFSCIKESFNSVWLL